MPVWHELTQEWRERDDFAVVGITQEQHPDRCRLFAQWHDIDWPILWDPLNVTEAAVVPNFIAIDEHGIVRSLRPNPTTFEDEFLNAEFAAPKGGNPSIAPVQRAYLETPSGRGFQGPLFAAYSRLLWGEPAGYDDVIALLEADLDDPVVDPRAQFRLGVAYRMRFDSPHRRAGDFQAALDQWGKALAAQPNQYIWRRRIQQYGPALDKPYPFYDWIAQARSELAARGVEVPALSAALTGSELLGRGEEPAAADAGGDPDPENRIHPDSGDWLAVETAVARDTSPGRRERAAARVHVSLIPRAGGNSAWNNEADAPVAWVRSPEGWDVRPRRIVLEQGSAETSNEPRRFDFEVFGPREPGNERVRLTAVVLYNMCEDDSGKCLFRRREIEIEVPSGS